MSIGNLPHVQVQRQRTRRNSEAQAKLARLRELASEINRTLATDEEVAPEIGHRTHKRAIKASRDLLGAIGQAEADARARGS